MAVRHGSGPRHVGLDAGLAVHLGREICRRGEARARGVLGTGRARWRHGYVRRARYVRGIPGAAGPARPERHDLRALRTMGSGPSPTRRRSAAAIFERGVATVEHSCPSTTPAGGRSTIYIISRWRSRATRAAPTTTTFTSSNSWSCTRSPVASRSRNTPAAGQPTRTARGVVFGPMPRRRYSSPGVG